VTVTSEGAEKEVTERPACFSFAIRRGCSGGVIVALRGEVDQLSAKRLTRLLRDLIDDQGNGVVVFGLQDVSGVHPEALELFSAASGWARRHGTSFRLHGLPQA
jgi:anti-anti-sigma regulatory factor